MSSGWRSSPGRPSRFCRWRPSLPRSRGACSLQAGGPQRRDSRSPLSPRTRLIIENKDGPTQKYLLVFGVLLSVFIQEMFRFAYYRLLKKASEGLKTINPDEAAPSMQLLAYVSGLGFGIMSGVFSFVNTLSNSLGPGTVGIHGDSPQFFLNSAFMTLVIILLHVFWGIVFFDACEKKKWYVLLIVLLTHLLVSAQVSIGAVRTLSFGTQVCV
ncbi:PREDICTED: gamma-secretase subunit APH-1B isoform X3 [Chinchilla lanigera]|uniref:gamma-secretase subunit APH-1B isoform X3 n=1 Tax=Chinchilla lanigera TaxID=34839 RepID=UPI0006983991|nr:PREDICTED: gamma-secretase subunit APH-1B isoform X3 [Chinchilla lanigera]